MLTVQDIKNIKFKRSKLGGYSTDNVDDFIDEVEASFEELVNKCNRQNEKIAELTSKVADYTDKQDSIRELIEGAQKFSSGAIKESRAKAENLIKEAETKSEEMVKDAETKSEEMVKDAETKSEEMVKDAETKSEEMIKEAQARAEGMIKEAEMRAKNLMEEAQSKVSKANKETDKKIKAKIELLDDLNRKVSNFRSELLDAYKSHLKLVDIFPKVNIESERERFKDLNKPSEMEEKYKYGNRFIDREYDTNDDMPELDDVSAEILEKKAGKFEKNEPKEVKEEAKDIYSGTSDFTFEMGSQEEDVKNDKKDVENDYKKPTESKIDSFMIPGIDFESAFKALSDKENNDIDEISKSIAEDNSSKYAKGMSPLDLFNLK